MNERIAQHSQLTEYISDKLSHELDEDLRFKEFQGGFTPIKKFIAEKDGHKVYFIKYVERSSEPVHAAMTDFEAKFYGIVAQIGEAKGLFPELQFQQSTNEYSLIALSYVDAAWGVTNSVDQVDQLAQGLKVLSSTGINNDLKTELKYIDKARKKFLSVHDPKTVPRTQQPENIRQAWSGNGFLDSVNRDEYTQSDPDIYQEIINASSHFKDTGGIVLRDLNFGNFGVTLHGAVFIDPAFAGFGSAAGDRATLGLNLLLEPSLSEEVKEHVRLTLLEDRKALAYKASQYVVAGSLPYNPVDEAETAWIKYHQKVAGLAIAELRK